MAEVELLERNAGKEIRVYTDEKVAVSVRASDEEVIYLPSASESDSSYYVEQSSSLVSTEYGYTVLHEGEVSEIELIS